MKITSNLKLMRKEWYNAFYSLNIGQLDYLEADWFFSTNGTKLIYKKHQLRKLSLLRQDNPTVFQGTRREEIDLHIRELGGIAVVSGTAKITGGDDEISLVQFIESWIKIRDAWKLQFLTFESSVE
ncbi:nuclear transport factor 2 family protein [Klebsiella variicola]|uniref:nuclear transport factor 2 family protein n=1 Tax=Klebsiella variicola TaxID=244366 RepID=UPI0003BE5787|nr:nuclear transport factor 2 family protein [Klebsiella variicola]ESN40840.1 hypothetical protein L366_03255 [Klebsiella variicola]